MGVDLLAALQMSLDNAIREAREAREARVLKRAHSGACPWTGPELDDLTADDCTCLGGVQ
jgi:tRNA A-37 threonylcarbamoyl transferase component Bud32